MLKKKTMERWPRIYNRYLNRINYEERDSGARVSRFPSRRASLYFTRSTAITNARVWVRVYVRACVCVLMCAWCVFMCVCLCACVRVCVMAVPGEWKRANSISGSHSSHLLPHRRFCAALQPFLSARDSSRPSPVPSNKRKTPIRVLKP